MIKRFELKKVGPVIEIFEEVCQSLVLIGCLYNNFNQTVEYQIFIVTIKISCPYFVHSWNSGNGSICKNITPVFVSGATDTHMHFSFSLGLYTAVPAQDPHLM